MQIHFTHAQLRKQWATLRGSYWFVPALLSLAAVGLATYLIYLDAYGYTGWLGELEFVDISNPDGARGVLSTIAGSMITVAGVVFSITIVAVVYASSQFGPRLLTNFMQDRGNQVTLGTFIGTFIYCLLVLRTVRTGDAPGASFVPQLSLLVGIVLALVSVGVLIFYIHHIPESIHISNVVANIGNELLGKIDDLFPEMIGYAAPEERDVLADVPDAFFEEAAAVTSNGNGYVQVLDERGLLKLARDSDLVIRVIYRPGDFVMEGTILAYAWPAERVDEDVERSIRHAFAWGRERTQTQDVLFLVNEPVEIASRALSPSMNDPFTAMTCMDWLGAGLRRLAHREVPGAHRYDADGNLRLIAGSVSFQQYVETAFGRLRPYASRDANAALHFMKTLADAVYDIEEASYRSLLVQEARRLLAHSTDALEPPVVKMLADRFRVLVRLNMDRSDRDALASAHRWLSGSG